MMQLGIRQKVILTATLPVIVATLIISYYMTQSRLDDAQAALYEKSRSNVDHLAAASEFGIFSHNTEFLKKLADSFLSEDVIFITISDASRQILVREVDDSGISQRDYFIITRPVIPSGIDIQGDQGTGDQSREIGYVSFAVSTDRITAITYEIIETSVLLTLSIILITVIAAYRISATMVNPLLSLSKASEDIKNGMPVRVDYRKQDEIGTLVRTFTDMADTISRSRRHLQEQVTIATRTLEATIRDLQLKNQELDIEREKAIEAGNEKMNFLARMSHEMRSPVNAIKGFSKLLLRNDENDDQVKYIHNIIASSNQLIDVIDDILGFSRLNSGQDSRESSQFNLGDFLEDIVIQASPEAQKKGLHIATQFPYNSSLEVIGDPIKIRHIITNLVSNAIKFTTEGSIVVRALFTMESGEQITLELSVIDTGIGISDTALQEVFAPFYQEDASLSRNYQGTGLGLAIANSLAESIHGRISVASEKGKGSTFTLTIPLQRASSAEAVMPDYLGLETLIYESNPQESISLRNTALQWTDHVQMTRNARNIANALRATTDCLIVGLGYDRQENGLAIDSLNAILADRKEMLVIIVYHDIDEVVGILPHSETLYTLRKPTKRSDIYAIAKSYFETHASNDVRDSSQAAASYRILIAEDDQFNMELFSTILDNGIFDLTLVSNGQEALEQARAMHFDVIITDIHLPLLDGLSLSQKIRETERNRETPIIAITADVFAREHPENARYIDHWLTKPVDEEHVLESVRKFISVQEQRGATSSSPAAIANNRNLLDKFITTMMNHIEKMKSCSDDLVVIAREAHQISGVCGYYDLKEIHDISQKIERLCQAGDDDGRLQGYIEEIERQMNLFVTENHMAAQHD